MTTRSHSKSIVFCHSFELKGVDRILPPGDYRVVTDEELIEELSFPAYRRAATMIFVPAGIAPCFLSRDGGHRSSRTPGGSGARPKP
jgi:hypothetical protein